MRARLILAGLMAWPAPALAAGAPAPVAAPAPPADAGQVDKLQQQVLASQQTIATLERELAEARDRAVVMEVCRVKNGRLVLIARELIEAYGRRWRMGHNDPLQLGRRRFEYELQALSEAVYTARIDVPVPPVPGEKPAAFDAPAPAPAKPAATPPAAGAGHTP